MSNGDHPARNEHFTIGVRPRLADPFEAEHHAYRQDLRTCAKAWSPEVVAGWASEGHLPADVFAALGDAGAFTRRWERGALEGLLYAVVLAEEAARVSSGLGLAVTVHTEVFCGLIQRLGRTDRQSELLAAALAGRVIGCFAVTEPRGGSDILGVTTTLTPGDGGWHVRGEKRFISNAGTATHAVVLARRLDDNAGSRRQEQLVLIPLDANGVNVTGFYPKAGSATCDAAHIQIDTMVGDDALLGVAGLGGVHVMQALELERLAVSAQLLVAARQSLRLAAAYMRRREQFGQRLMDHQALRHRLADMTARTWMCESMLNNVVQGLRKGQRLGPETGALKLLCAETAQQATDEALQFFGGRGYTANYPLQGAWRDVRLARIGAGTDEIMRELVADAIDRADPEYEEVLDGLVADDLPVPRDRYGGLT